LAIRAAVAAKVNVTYKILYNDAVAMTGGQAVDGTISVRQIAQQMAAEGIQRIALVTEDLSRYDDPAGLPSHVTLHDRADMDKVQRELREVQGVSVLIYDQVCAAEKRRRRKKGELPKLSKRLFINEAVCEGCGDCGMESNCTSIMPLETEFGRKRTIDQSSCNQDYSCVKGFCPSFVTVTGGTLKKMRSVTTAKDSTHDNDSALPEPVPASCETSYNVLINGIGGTGVITIGALLGMAGHLEGKGVSVLDMTGMSQKNGSVTSHVRIAATPDAIRAQRIATGEADLVLGCDMLTAGTHDAIAKMRPGRTRAVINSHQQPIGPFARQPDWQFPADEVKTLIDASVAGAADYIDATQLATALTGDAIATNLFMLGYAYQKGLLPLSECSLMRAIELNGVAIAFNQEAFRWGRRAAVDPTAVEKIALPSHPVVLNMPETLSALVTRRVAYLTSYQDADYAHQYQTLVDDVKQAEAKLGQGDKLSKAVAKSLFKLMAYKDEYEVARLYNDPAFMKALKQQFDGKLKLSFNLAPPLFAKKDAQGQPQKAEYGSWVWPMFKLLAKLKALRGTRLDPFGWTAERKMERQLISDYRELITNLLPTLTAERLSAAITIASLPEKIRGFGHVKAASAERYREELKNAMADYSSQRTDHDAEHSTKAIAEFSTDIRSNKDQRLTA
ncbi:MAG: indolepyruvate ferredoxin oxidoreductase family protein, partial [Betaproteobacteria bacterium]|nr:indolepyruvate ferredoxin oxidoreductase family protein [Betaproteobacteria bacterium]